MKTHSRPYNADEFLQGRNNKKDVTREHSDYLHTVEALARTVQPARESGGEPAAVHFRP